MLVMDKQIRLEVRSITKMLLHTSKACSLPMVECKEFTKSLLMYKSYGRLRVFGDWCR